MVSFTATYTSATGQPRTVTVKANDAVAARRLLRRRGIKAEELRQDKGKAKADEPSVKPMVSFIATYTAVIGQQRSASIQATDAHSTRRLLRRRGFKAEDIYQDKGKNTAKPDSQNGRSSASEGWLSMDLGEAFQKPPGVKEKAIWASKLAALVDAGVPIVRSLDLMATQQKLPMFKKALTSVGLEVNQGTAMAAAMRQWPKVFDQLTIAMVEAGEAGGVLDESLKRLAKLLEDNARLQNQIKGALGYPVAVLVIAILVFLGMTIFLIPTFAGIFEDLGAELPMFTQLMVDLSALLRSSASLVFAGILMVGAWMIGRYYNTHTGRRVIDKLILKLPLFGDLIMKTATAQFCRIFSSLTRAGVPILMSMEISSETAGNSIISDAILDSRTMVQEGVLLSTALTRQKVLPDMALSMLSIGEETGEMDRMLSKVADFYEDEVSASVKALTSMLEPAMIVVVGGIVGSILLAMYLPMFTVFDQIQ